MNKADLEHAGGTTSPRSSSEGPEAGRDVTLWRSVLDQDRDRSEISGLEEVPMGAGSMSDLSGEPAALEAIPAAGGMERWLPKLLRTLTIAALVVGLPAVAGATYAAYSGGRPVLIPLWLSLYLLLLVALVWRQMPYYAHAGILLGVLYGAGALAFFQPGYSGVGTSFLLCLAALAAVLLGGEVGAVCLAVAFITAAIASYGLSTGMLALPGREAGVLGLGDWWWSPVLVLVLGGGLMGLAVWLRQHLLATLRRLRELGEAASEYEIRLSTQANALERRTSQLRAIDSVGRLAASQADPGQVLSRILDLAAVDPSWYSVSIFVAEESGERLGLLSMTGAAAVEIMAERWQVDTGSTSVVGWVAEHGEPYVALDIHADSLDAPHPLLSETESEAAVPLLIDSKLYGVLDVQARERAAFDEADIRFLSILGNWAASALEAPPPVPVPSETMDALYQVSSRLSGAATKADVAEAIVDVVAETRAGTCLVAEFLRDADGEIDGLLCLRAWRRGRDAGLKPGTRLPLSSALFPVELLEGTWVVPDVRTDEKLSRHARELFDRMGVRALIGFPLKGRRESFGQVLVLYADAGPFPAPTVRLYEFLEHQAGPAFERAQRLDDAYRQATYTELAAEFASRLHESLDVDGVLSTAAREMARRLELVAIAVRLGPDRKAEAWHDPQNILSQESEWREDMKRAAEEREPIRESEEALIVPITVGGRVIGVVDAHKPVHAEAGEELWTRDEVGQMEVLCQQLGAAVETARLYEDTQRRSTREQLVGEVAARMRESLDMATVLKSGAQGIREAMDLPAVTVRLVDDDGERRAEET